MAGWEVFCFSSWCELKIERVRSPRKQELEKSSKAFSRLFQLDIVVCGMESQVFSSFQGGVNSNVKERAPRKGHKQEQEHLTLEIFSGLKEKFTGFHGQWISMASQTFVLICVMHPRSSLIVVRTQILRLTENRNWLEYVLQIVSL